MEIIQREVSLSHIPSRVGNAIDEIISCVYHLMLENQILRRRISEAEKLVCDNSIQGEMELTHDNTMKNESERMREILTREKPAVTREEPAVTREESAVTRDMHEVFTVEVG